MPIPPELLAQCRVCASRNALVENLPRQARVAPERVKDEMNKAGYALDAEHAFLPRQYFLVFR